MESKEPKRLTIADFDADLAAAIVCIQAARHRGDSRCAGRRILNQTPAGKINVVQTEFEPAEVRVRQSG